MQYYNFHTINYMSLLQVGRFSHFFPIQGADKIPSPQ